MVLGDDSEDLQDQINDLIEVFSGNDWGLVWKAKFALETKQHHAIQAVIELLDRDERVTLMNTADLIYPGAQTFYGHGWIVNYDIDWISMRAGWALEELTFEDFGFSETTIDHDALLQATMAGRTDVPLRDVAPVSVDAGVRKKQRLQAIRRAKQWWKRNREGWMRLPALISALESDNPRRLLSALNWLRFEDSPIDGFSQDIYASRVLPIVKRLAESSNKGVAAQAGLLLQTYNNGNGEWPERKQEIASFLRTHPLTASHLIHPGDIREALDSKHAWALCRRLDGYKELRKSFEVEDAIIGCVNFLPDSLKVSVRTTNRGLINGVWWWNPLDEFGEPNFDWKDLIKIHATATGIISKHTWLAEWRESSFGRLVELHAYGYGIAETDDDLRIVHRLWHQAGLTGHPACKVLARRGDTAWAEIYFGNEEPAALIAAVSEPDWKGEHWLDRLEKLGAASSRYVVVDPTGNWGLHTHEGNRP